MIDKAELKKVIDCIEVDVISVKFRKSVVQLMLHRKLTLDELAKRIKKFNPKFSKKRLIRILMGEVDPKMRLIADIFTVMESRLEVRTALMDYPNYYDIFNVKKVTHKEIAEYDGRAYAKQRVEEVGHDEESEEGQGEVGPRRDQVSGGDSEEEAMDGSGDVTGDTGEQSTEATTGGET